MLLSMSNRSLAEPVFTLSVLGVVCMGAFSPSKDFYFLLYFHRIEKFGQNSPGMYCFPCSHFRFSVGAGGSLNKPPCRGWPKFLRALPARNLPATRFLLRMTLQSHPRSRHKEDHDERSESEYLLPFSYQFGRHP
jgi:hypothetical protein